MRKTVVISGGSEGLGYATAKALVTDYNVYILAPTKDKLVNAAQELGCKYKVCDVSNWEQVSSVVREIQSESSSIDICINNAGLWIQDELDTNDPEYISKVLNVNTLGVMYLSKAVIPMMKKNSSGIILNVISQAGLHAKAQRTVYNASKWGVTGFTKSLYQELTPYGIKVLGIYPSLINTSMFKKMGFDRDMSGALDPSEVAGAIKFMLESKDSTAITELGMLNINY